MEPVRRTLEYVEGEALFVHVLAGRISMNDVLAASISQAEDPRYKPGDAAIWDVRSAVLDDIGHDEIVGYSLLDFGQPRDGPREDPIAVIVASERDFAIARQLLAYLDWRGEYGFVSRDYEAAQAWIAEKQQLRARS